jgi:VIT1/CCC1 family predicted Fe2+/Mn2+ transporter
MTVESSRRSPPFVAVLDPMERSMEALFGLIMVLTFTLSLSVRSAGHAEVREMLIGALGCNLAWGIIDACFYLMGTLGERGRRLQRLRRLRATADDSAITDVMKEALPSSLVELMTPGERLGLRDRIARLPEPPLYARLTPQDVKGAAGVFLWVFLITLPVALPFVVIDDPVTALRVSNGIALFLLFFIGHRLAMFGGFRPWRTSVLMVVAGLAMVGMTIALGG